MGLHQPHLEPATPAFPFGAADVQIPDGCDYVLGLRKLCNRALKPMAFPTLRQMAQHLHRNRGRGGLQLADAPLAFALGGIRHGVSVWTLDESGERRFFLGWCWLRGGNRHALEAELRLVAPGPDC